MKKKYPIGGYAPGNYLSPLTEPILKDDDVKELGLKDGGLKVDSGLEEQANALYQKYCTDEGLVYHVIDAANFCLWYMAAKRTAGESAVWVKGAPKERKQHFAKVLSLLDETPLDAIIEPVPNTTDYWSTCGPGFRFSITEDKIVEHLVSAASPSAHELTPGAPTTTGTYFAVIKGYINDEPQMYVLHYQSHKNIYKAAGHAFNIEVKGEDVVGYVNQLK